MDTRDLAIALIAMLVYNIDEADDDPYDDAEILDNLSEFIGALPEAPPALAVYDVAFRSGTPFPLTTEHQRLIHDTVEAWVNQ